MAAVGLEAALSLNACLRDQSQTPVHKSVNSLLTVTNWVGELRLTDLAILVQLFSFDHQGGEKGPTAWINTTPI